MRFQCSFCLSLIETEQKFGSRLECPSCRRKGFVPRSRFAQNCVIDDFVIREKIGGGSTGRVYKAIQLSLAREVALKVIEAGNTDGNRFEDLMREARVAARLNHVNLIQALALGQEDGIYYMAMNLVEGETLKTRLLREGTLEVDEALHIIQQIAEALWYAWESAQMIHRDVKPENIMITVDGIIKLTDMGLAVILSGLDNGGTVCGSPSYMSPEQFSGGESDTRSDIYSLGITLYEMLSGELPFKAETLQEVANQHFSEEAMPLHRLSRDIPLNVSNLVRRMIEKYPEDRFSDMNQLLNEIWEVRQVTAPDNSMIPDVHTISMSRLSYDRQRSVAQISDNEPQNAIRDEIERHRSRRKDIFYIVILAFVFLFMIFSYVFQYYLSKAGDEYTNSQVYPIQKRVEEFEDNMASGHIAHSILEVEVANILRSFPSKRLPQLDSLYWKVRTYSTEIREKKLQVEITRKENHIEELSKKLNHETQSNTELSQELTTKIKEFEVVQKKYKATEKALGEQMKKISDELNILNLKAQITTRHEDVIWKNMVLNTLYFSVRNRDFNRAKATVAYQSQEYSGKYKEWLSPFLQVIAELEQIDSLFFSKTSSLVGLTIPSEGRVVMVESGMIFYQSKSSGNSVRSRAWYDLEPKTLYALIRRAAPKLGENNDLQFKLALYGGNMAHPALDVAPSPIQEWRHAVVEYAIEAILISAYYNRTQASAEAAILLERFKLAPALAAEIEKKLKPLL